LLDQVLPAKCGAMMVALIFTLVTKHQRLSSHGLTSTMRYHINITAFDDHAVWIQNKISRISLVVDRSDDAPAMSITAASGRVEIEIEPEALPIRCFGLMLKILTCSMMVLFIYQHVMDNLWRSIY